MNLWETVGKIGTILAVAVPILKGIQYLLKPLTDFFIGLDVKLDLLIKSHQEFLDKFSHYLDRLSS